MTQRNQTRFIAIVPAAGRGVRVGANEPKQYLSVAGEPLIAHTLRALLAAQWIDTVHVVTAPGDTTATTDRTLQALTADNAPRLHWHAVGGQTRADSVAGGLLAARATYSALAETHAGKSGDANDAGPDVWAMVHDAARPGVSLAQLNALRDAIAGGAQGALLATRVADTVKQAAAGGDAGAPIVQATIERDELWLAQTPQVFRLDQLLNALQRALQEHRPATDESSAMEHAGIFAALVPGSWHNMKVTTAADLQLVPAAMQLNNRASPDDEEGTNGQ